MRRKNVFFIYNYLKNGRFTLFHKASNNIKKLPKTLTNLCQLFFVFQCSENAKCVFLLLRDAFI